MEYEIATLDDLEYGFDLIECKSSNSFSIPLWQNWDLMIVEAIEIESSEFFSVRIKRRAE